MENALISVIVPVYNVAVPGCVCRQPDRTDLQNLEIILIDDGFTDQSGGLV